MVHGTLKRRVANLKSNALDRSNSDGMIKESLLNTSSQHDVSIRGLHGVSNMDNKLQNLGLPTIDEDLEDNILLSKGPSECGVSSAEPKPINKSSQHNWSRNSSNISGRF